MPTSSKSIVYMKNDVQHLAGEWRLDKSDFVEKKK